MIAEKWCIFHVPNYIDPDAKSGSHVRPPKMIDAFKSIGYNVDIVMGYGSTRKKQIDRIKAEIKKGKKYDFVYSESSTMPTLLTEKKHLPLFPRLDFSFLTYCKRNNIRIGLFYRDIHWKFEDYKSKVSLPKRMVTIPFYKYDLKKYEKIVDVLYLPSGQMAPLLNKYKIKKVDLLPPGAVYNGDIVVQRNKYFKSRKEGPLNIFYVGGVSGIYDVTEVFNAVFHTNNAYLTVCARKEEWEKVKSKYTPFLNERVKIIHESGEHLKKYYMKSDLCCCYFPISKYMSFSMPIKLFEYLGFVTPVIATGGMEAGKFVQKWDYGFCIDYDDYSMIELLERINEDQDILLEKHKNSVTCLMKNTWEERALKVVKDLKGE